MVQAKGPRMLKLLWEYLFSFPSTPFTLLSIIFVSTGPREQCSNTITTYVRTHRLTQ